MIGHLNSESSAKTLADYLVSLDIRNLVEPDSEGWAIWVYSEDQLEAGHKALTSYLQNPTDVRYQQASQVAAEIKEKQRKEKAAFQKRIYTKDRIWTSWAVGPMTLCLILASTVATLLLFTNPRAAQWLSLSEVPYGLPELRSGQFWRLITPIFLHLSFFHLLFNMWWLWDLGSMIELRRGSKTLLILVLVIGVGSNLGQYLHAGALFGGMSGVIYGLAGFIWLRGQRDPASGLYMSQANLAILLVWFVLCLAGVIGDVANGAHAVGLVMGMILGASPLAQRFL